MCVVKPCFLVPYVCIVAAFEHIFDMVVQACGKSYISGGAGAGK